MKAMGLLKKHRNMVDLLTGNLFATESNLKIVRLNVDDVIFSTDNVKLLSQQIAQHEVLYPKINEWVKTKVFPGVKSGNRVVYIGLNNEEPVVSAILKLGEKTKICHLHIDHKIQNQNLGDLFFSMMALDAQRRANKVYFTLPESLWENKKDFFTSFGFKNVQRSFRQYRSFEEELWSSTSFQVMWKKTLEKLPKIITSLTKTHDNIFNGILMSIKPEFVEKIHIGEKIVEIRKKFSMKWRDCRVTIYSSTPDQAIYGYATIERIKKDTPEKIWSEFGAHIGSTKKDFNEYTSCSREIYAISLKNFEPYLNPVYLRQIESLLNEELRPPQSYLSLDNNENWAKAVSIAELLHNRFWIYRLII